MYSANGSIPIYLVEYKGKRIALYMSKIGSSACVAGIEEIIAKGAKKIVFFGSCGLLDVERASGKIIVPSSAVRDEGTSYHYVERSDEIFADEKSVNHLVSCIESLNEKYVVGKVWTTDAIYRETRELVERRKANGCLCVDMHSSATLAVTQFRQIQFAQFLFGTDSLDSGKWEIRNLHEYGLSNADMYLKLAFECVIGL